MDYSVEKPYAARLWVPANSAVLPQVINRIEGAAGGLTQTHGWGHYFGVRESVVVLEVFYSDENWRVNAALRSAVEMLLDAGEREVLLEQNGKRHTYSRLVEAL